MQNNKGLVRWLFLCCGLIFVMVLVGAITRLTESGLSMVEWRAMMDMMPPMTTEAWQSAFAKYKTTPEYLVKNHGMDLDAFQSIYFWEWTHRLLGRVIGLVYALPLAYFWMRGRIPQKLKPRFIFFLALGGLQGFIGWYMVKSGLVNEPRVSHYRLALHFGTALVLFSCLLAQAVALHGRLLAKLQQHPIGIYARQLQPHTLIALALVALTVIWGAFVAGLDAGLIYNEFPTMGGKWIPSDFLFQKPWWTNFFSNHATVQWTHRVLAILSFVTVFSLGLRAIWTRNPVLKKAGHALAGMIFVQVVLGVATLLTHVHLHVAVTHQAGAVITLGLLVYLLTVLRLGR